MVSSVNNSLYVEVTSPPALGPRVIATKVAKSVLATFTVGGAGLMLGAGYTLVVGVMKDLLVHSLGSGLPTITFLTLGGGFLIGQVAVVIEAVALVGTKLLANQTDTTAKITKAALAVIAVVAASLTLPAAAIIGPVWLVFPGYPVTLGTAALAACLSTALAVFLHTVAFRLALFSTRS